MRSLIFLLLLFPVLAWGQTDEKDWTLTGYVKNLQGWFFFNDGFSQDNLIHNRLNFSWYMEKAWTFRADLRTRAFFGDLVRLQDDYADLVDNANNDYFDLSLVVLDSRSWVLHTMLDRLYLEYNKNDWEIRLGRQRVNWGISTIWNPNDIFNAFAFTDFDYEERPGSDALSIKRYTGFASSVELVARMADRLDESVIAGLWRFNQWNYDFQVLTGIVQNEWTLGGGWAGNIKNAGFKGEWSFFFPLEDDTRTSFAATLGIDYVFESQFYLNFGYLYNSNGSTSDNILGLFDFELSAKNLYPYRHSILLQGSYPISPLLNSSLAIIYSPVQSHPLFLNPTFTLSVANNWDFDLVGQIVFNRQNGDFNSPLQVFFLRLKYSF